MGFVFAFLGLAFLVSPLVLLLWQLHNRDRLNKLERALTWLRDSQDERLTALEASLNAFEGAEPPAAAEQAGVVSQAVAAASEPEPARAGPERVADSPSVPARPAPPPVEAPRIQPGPPQAAAPRAGRSNAEWEELIGGSWLNKIGVVVLIVGVALLLGYSMTNLGAAGRVALGLAVSAAMLAGGAVLEGRDRYRIVARGLIGGGWAGFYFTTFAMHGVEAARIIESPIVGTVLLLAVAVAMLLHSMTYRSETVTALAYFVTFVTLAITPATRFSMLASVPAAVSLLFVGRRFKWEHMMVAGVVFTYGAYIVRAMSPEISAADDFVFGIALLCVYWVMFELFDLSSLSGGRQGGIVETLFPINATGFLLAAMLVWDRARPETLWVLFAIAAGAFTASSAVRASMLGLTNEDEVDLVTRIRRGSYEGAAVLGALLLALAIGERLDGWHRIVAWLLQAQLLIMTGLSMRLPFLRHLGSVVLIAPVSAVLFEEIPSLGSFEAFGRSWQRATPTALLTAGLLYLDRGLIRRARRALVGGLEHSYTWVGTLLIAAVLAFELPEMWFGPAWLAFGILLVAYSRRQTAGDLFVQGCLLTALAWIVALLINVPSDDIVWGLQARWITALPLVPLFYGLAYLYREAQRRASVATGSDSDAEPTAGSLRGLDGLADRLDVGVAVVLSFGATFLTSWFLLFEVSGRWLTVAWGLQGVALLAVGIAMAARGMRIAGLALLVICVAKVFFYDLNELETIFKIASFIILGSLLIGVSFAYSRYREQIRRLL